MLVWFSDNLGENVRRRKEKKKDILGRKISTSPSTGAGFSCMKCRIGLVPVQTSTRLPLHSKEFLNRRQPPPTTKIRLLYPIQTQ
ncbi:unnamed protein product, partial [Vitis vinifera]|uniref:Uncharacterized protein n=1 Tax=Vitis vinifera TaxID=29760 RepID=D7TQ17_VITVI